MPIRNKPDEWCSPQPRSERNIIKASPKSQLREAPKYQLVRWRCPDLKSQSYQQLVALSTKQLESRYASQNAYDAYNSSDLGILNVNKAQILFKQTSSMGHTHASHFKLNTPELPKSKTLPPQLLPNQLTASDMQTHIASTLHHRSLDSQLNDLDRTASVVN